MSDKPKDEVIIAYKGFDKDLKCRGFQYEVGKTYGHDGDVDICHSGFHSCTNPMDVFSYYNITDCRLAEIEASGVIKTHDDDSKIASANITIKAEIKIGDYITKCVIWLLDKCKGSLNASSGYSSTAASSGNSSKAASIGDSSTAASSGNSSTAAASGYSSTAASSGYSSKAAASGYYSTAASIGDYSKAAASGNSSKAAASGNSSTAAASGYYSTAAASGYYSIAMVAGINGRAKAGSNGAFALPWKDGEQIRICVGIVGENVKADTWYEVDNGQLTEA